MKLIKSTVFYGLMAMIVLALSCKDDDDGSQNGNADNFTATCCQIPHLEACVGGAKVFVPNAFTPNGDGINDIFLPYGDAAVKEIASLSISNEENVVIFASNNFMPNDHSRGWDGLLPDGTLSEGLFLYTISITNIADETEEFEGMVCCRVEFPYPCVDFEKHCVYGTHHNGSGGFEPFIDPFESCQ